MNREVLKYLEAERVAPRETTGPWVIDGYSLATQWTRIDPWPVDVPKDEGLPLLASVLQRAVENATGGNPSRPADNA